MSEEHPWRQQLKGIRAFVETLKESEGEERDTTTIAGKFAEALNCLEDAACHLRDIDNQYNERYPDDECEEPELFFWQEIRETIDAGCFRETFLQRIQEKLEAVAEYMPKELTA